MPWLGTVFNSRMPGRKQPISPSMLPKSARVSPKISPRDQCIVRQPPAAKPDNQPDNQPDKSGHSRSPCEGVPKKNESFPGSEFRSVDFARTAQGPNQRQEPARTISPTISPPLEPAKQPEPQSAHQSAQKSADQQNISNTQHGLPAAFRADRERFGQSVNAISPAQSARQSARQLSASANPTTSPHRQAHEQVSPPLSPSKQPANQPTKPSPTISPTTAPQIRRDVKM